MGVPIELFIKSTMYCPILAEAWHDIQNKGQMSIKGKELNSQFENSPKSEVANFFSCVLCFLTWIVLVVAKKNMNATL